MGGGGGSYYEKRWQEIGLIQAVNILVQTFASHRTT